LIIEVIGVARLSRKRLRNQKGNVQETGKGVRSSKGDWWGQKG
jgi:hypothetical protein